MEILGIDTNAKTVKGSEFGYLTGISYLAPSDESGVANTCPDASSGCREACLFTAGRGAMDNVKSARVNKTLAFFKNKNVWMKQLAVEITRLIKKAKKDGKLPCIRLNGTSDLPWERVKLDGKNIMEHFPSVQFYDYTKSISRMRDFLSGGLPSNYHLTFSRSEDNDADVNEVLANGGNVAVVFRGSLPETFNGFKVVDGDLTDLRFADEKNVVVGLTQKGKAKKDESGFVVEPLGVPLPKEVDLIAV